MIFKRGDRVIPSKTDEDIKSGSYLAIRRLMREHKLKYMVVKSNRDKEGSDDDMIEVTTPDGKHGQSAFAYRFQLYQEYTLPDELFEV